MSEHKLFIIYGAGNDSIGLVKRITGDIFKLNGNILDMRQDVIHGLFTVFIVVDLSGSESSVTEFEAVIGKISLDTGLKLSFEKYYPVPRSPDKKNILLILLGRDKEGIIALISESLSKYKINIEFSQMIAREGIFLMELLVDISSCIIPVENLKTEIDRIMDKMQIKAMYQFENVFNKKRRAIAFNCTHSLISKETTGEILKLAGIEEKDIAAYYKGAGVENRIYDALTLMDGLPVEIIENITGSAKLTSSTVELIQTLKVMGYKTAVISNSLCPVSLFFKNIIDQGYCFELSLKTDPDEKTIDGNISFEEFMRIYSEINPEKITGNIVKNELIDKEDLVIVDVFNAGMNSGIGIEFDMKLLLEYLNKKVITKENLIGILGGFGAV